MIGILSGQDQAVALWTWHEFKLMPMSVDRAYALVNDNRLIGSILFQYYSGIDVELSYYGEWTVTAGIYKFVLQQALETLKVERMTFKTRRSNRRLIAWMLRQGCIHEGNSRRYYGREDCSRNTATRLVIFREQMERLLHRGKVH